MRLNHIVEISGEIELLTGLHIGAGDLAMRIGGVDNAVIRDARSNNPFIPGSSLKGKIRSLLEWRSGAVRRSDPLGKQDLERAAGRAEETAVRAILQLFGVSGDAGMSDDEAAKLGPTRVSFRDALLVDDRGSGSNLPLTEVKSENSIDRIKGVAKNPRQTERVVAGVRFRFQAAVKELEGDTNLVATLLTGMRLLELDSLGGSGSRGYGKIKFRELRRDGEAIQEHFDAIDPFSASAGMAV
jgi:CRISPR-associated protein Csm3